jgi:hypothetical protein
MQGCELNRGCCSSRRRPADSWLSCPPTVDTRRPAHCQGITGPTSLSSSSGPPEVASDPQQTGEMKFPQNVAGGPAGESWSSQLRAPPRCSRQKAHCSNRPATGTSDPSIGAHRVARLAP